MWVYCVFNVASFILMNFLFPDFTGRRLEAIEKKLRQGTFKPRDFAR